MNKAEIRTQAAPPAPGEALGVSWIGPGTTSQPAAVVGQKGRALQEMSVAGAPVPAGFVLTGEPRGVSAAGELSSPERARLRQGLELLAKHTGRTLGDAARPLLLALRSSPPERMPGLLGAVVNLGLTEPIVEAIVRHNPSQARWAWDAYRRCLHGYGLQVLQLDPEGFDAALDSALEKARADTDADLEAPQLQALARSYRDLIERTAGALPAEPEALLERAVAAGFAAWNNPMAEEHRREAGLDDLPGLPLVVQVMVHGTLGSEQSGAGHVQSRVPATGERALNGTFNVQAEGLDLRLGARMPEPLKALQKRLPDIYAQLERWARELEQRFHDAQEIQFTVSEGQLYLLNCRPASRSAKASLKIALDLVQEGICTARQALPLVIPTVIDEYLHPELDKTGAKPPLTKGLPASPGSAVGQAVFFAEQAVELAAQGVKVILVRNETTPEDIDGLKVAEGILTVHGGLTSHAAVVGRGMGKCCVVGAGDLQINYLINEMTVGEVTVKRLDWISLDGNTGEVFLGQLPQVRPSLGGSVAKALEWADSFRTLGVHANADTPEDARRAVELGAEGIGLCRTEHMFFDIDRIPVFRKMILAVDQDGRSAALSDLLPLQRKDFMDIFRVMQGRPVTIRLLDPPLNEFLPKGPRSQSRMAKAMQIPVEVIQHRTEALSENNPMMGHRGCRLAITYPEIYNMQVRAIVEAACIVKKEGTPVHPEIMVPLVSTVRELQLLRRSIVELMHRVMDELGEQLEIKVGTMIETPRAAVCSADIARYADFFSFGTNDLTQMGYGFSRDDAGMFLHTYLDRGILETDPFMSLDQQGIGGLVRMSVQAGRSANPNLKFGICGEHGGDPPSVKFFHRVGLDYVSCSPFRIPVARLAAGQAAIEQAGPDSPAPEGKAGA